MKIKKILVANRGEIACRIIRTAQDLEIETVAVFSEADRFSLHLGMADECVPIGPAPSSESYLKIENIIETAEFTDCDAIHPGYGFLAENAKFAAACEKAGIIFIGPSSKAIQTMGSKSRAKSIMEKAGVPVVPGYHGSNQDAKFLKKEADKIGYPLLIKAIAGGGGKGMRLVKSPAEFADALKGAQREGKASFNNPVVLLEKYIDTPRHIEVQVFGDTKGNVIHLYERDCSIQRRHQKIIEEAPAPGMTEKLRARLTGAAVAAAKAIGYVNAGTVEFIVDARGGLTDETNFYFMEMNTRLQVEHPVTELVTGLDLVELQILVAEGKALPVKQKDISLLGHAIEGRLYAEDPENNFLPQTGKLHWFQIPGESDTFRFDTGYAPEDEISVFYDPMIAKMICWGEDRDDAIERFLEVVSTSQIAGVRTNLPFLGAVCRAGAFRAGELSTHFIEENQDELKTGFDIPGRDIVLSATLGYISERKFERGQTRKGNDIFSPWMTGGWRLNHAYAETMKMALGDHHFAFEARPIGETGIWNFVFENNKIVSGYLDESHFPAALTCLNSEAGSVEYALFTYFHENSIYVMAGGNTAEVILEDAAHVGEAEAEGLGFIKAPMPGKILEVLAKNGGMVEKGDALVIMEAMKMEYTLKAPRAGKVKGLSAKVGDQVGDAALLLEIEEN